MHATIKLLPVLVLGLIFEGAAAQDSRDRSSSEKGPIVAGREGAGPLLLRQREGGTPYDPQQALQPYATRRPVSRDVPVTGLIESPAEYEPMRGVLYYYTSSQWPSVVSDLVVGLTQDPAHDEIAYVVVPNASQQTIATNAFTADGADMSKVEFYIEPGDALWIRDYGPHFIRQDAARGIVDSHYYPTRHLDNFNPTLVGDDHMRRPTYDIGLYYSGGNFQPGPGRSGFVTSLINIDNPASQGFDAALIAELLGQYQGIDTLHVMPQLPTSVDGTGHIDMWLYIVDADTVIISEFLPGSNPTAIQITNDAVPYMEALGFEVVRVPAWNAIHPGYGNTHYTYTNAFRVNDRIFVPTYGEGNAAYLDEDAQALARWETAAGAGVEIVPINCYDIIWASGAIHCIVMQVPRYTPPDPCVHVISPHGGELFVCGSTETISWVASDTDNARVRQTSLYYSTDGGQNYDYITTASSESYDWTVPEVVTGEALVKAVVLAVDGGQAEGVSAGVFQIAPGQQTVYDFSTGAGVDKFGWGHQTSSWSTVNGNRVPVGTEIDALVAGAYGKLAASDASGGDADPNRYRSPNPALSYESTHVFEFTIGEDPADIDDIGIVWEGYADWCTQVELFVWDHVEGQWGDGAGLFGQNRFMDNWAGNRDGFLEGHLRSDFGRYVDGSGQMTLLVYGERGSVSYGSVFYMPTFHDYIAVTVSVLDAPGLPGDLNCDGNVSGLDIEAFLLAVLDLTTYQAVYGCETNGDFNGDSVVDELDVGGLVSSLLSG